MWFEREMKDARELVEQRVRKVLGTRLITIFAVFVALASAAALARPTVQAAASWFDHLRYYKLAQSAAYIERVGTNEFFSHKLENRYSTPGDPLHGVVTFQQKLTFDRAACTLTIHTRQRSSLVHFDDKTTKNVEDLVQDYTREEEIHLGSLDALEISMGVKVDNVFTDMERFKMTSGTWHVFASNRSEDSVHSKTTGGGTNVFPGDAVSNIATFHVISFKQISEFTDRFLYLDHWCGNSKKVEPYVEEATSQ
ncbi:hypothetical protein SAMN05216338_106031 [Bradyrhizobium sp. Rc2d]|uniref:hypothetical protein n=1 Tax=Bradyrhizobium sp. Rc2d TaxID=1855321 RepID=UPI00088DBBF2|nr:hypothetical protein [Bradyrhizobium sp. Rc2d]SDJ68927.1 hypothetical protein SAMN05216338_106031 [Bradyrhizobium sp. Rc2d]